MGLPSWSRPPLRWLLADELAALRAERDAALDVAIQANLTTSAALEQVEGYRALMEQSTRNFESMQGLLAEALDLGRA